MNHFRLRFLLLGLVAALAALLGLAGVQAQDEKVLVIGHAESTDSLDPARGYTQTTGIVLRATYETLVTFPDADASAIEPMLATEWSVSDDGLTYTFKLRDDVVFPSGNPLTADDVVFSINRLKNVQSSPAFQAANIASVAAVDAHTVAITLAAVDPAFLVRLVANWYSITDSATIKANGGTDAADAAAADQAEAFLNSTSVGTGPYMLESWEKTVQTVLVRNPSYSGPAPYFDRVIIQNIPEPASQKAALEAGDVDLALDLTADQIATLEGSPNLAIARGPGNIIHFLIMNADPEIGGPVADPKVQLAIRYALDYDGYKTLWGGVQPGTNMTVGFAGAFGEDKALKRDLERAKALLTEAGYPDGFEITLDYPDFSFQGVDMNVNAQKIQADLAEAGITVNLSSGELGPKLEAYRGGTQGFGYWFWGPDILDPSDFLAFLPGGKVASERARWTTGSDEMMALIESAKTETDLTQRIEIYGRLQALAQQTGPFAPFNQPDIQTAFAADLEGYVWHPQWLVNVALLSRSM